MTSIPEQLITQPLIRVCRPDCKYLIMIVVVLESVQSLQQTIQDRLEKYEIGFAQEVITELSQNRVMIWLFWILIHSCSLILFEMNYQKRSPSGLVQEIITSISVLR